MASSILFINYFIQKVNARFDEDTKASFMDLYTKIDAGVNPLEENAEGNIDEENTSEL